MARISIVNHFSAGQIMTSTGNMLREKGHKTRRPLNRGSICAKWLSSESNLSFNPNNSEVEKINLPHKFIWRTNELKVQAF